MKKLHRAMLATSAIVLTAACQDSITGPRSDATATAAPSFALTFDPDLVTYNSASCSLQSSANGAVACSWDVSNPNETSLVYWVQATLQVSYDCVNPKSGRIASSQIREAWTGVSQSGVSSPSLTGSGVSLPLPFLPTGYTGPMKKENACKGNTVATNLVWSLDYWEVLVSATEGTPRNSCYASDNRKGCLTA